MCCAAVRAWSVGQTVLRRGDDTAEILIVPADRFLLEQLGGTLLEPIG
jgi:hypothetical protein